mgnify:CR=1 FL=1
MTTHSSSLWYADRDDNGRGEIYIRAANYVGDMCAIAIALPGEYMQGNVALLTTAPELLAALEGILAGFQHGEFRRVHPRQSDSDPYSPALVAARAAIRKAKGETT